MTDVIIITKEGVLTNLVQFWTEVQEVFSFMSNNNGFQVAAFRATLEEISESSLLVHVVDIR